MAGPHASPVHGVLAALALACLPAAAAAQQPEVPVLAGGNAEFDACGSQGIVRGLDPDGDGFLAIRSGPSGKHVILDKVHNGAILNLCDERGAWIGVVYAHDGTDCRVGTPWPRRKAYAGPCRSGWAYRKFVGDFAG